MNIRYFHCEVSRLNFVWPGGYIMEALLLVSPSGFCVCMCVSYSYVLCEYFDIRVCVFLRCVYVCMCVCSLWQSLVLRVTSLSDLPWPLEASAPPHLFWSSPLWPRVRGLHLSGEHWCSSRRVRGYSFALGSKGQVGVLGPSHPHTSQRPHCSAACPTRNLLSTPRPPVQGFAQRK